VKHEAEKTAPTTSIYNATLLWGWCAKSSRLLHK